MKSPLPTIVPALILVASIGNLSFGHDEVLLIKDTSFAEGFGAAFIYGREYSGGRRPPLGEVTEYRDISPWQVFLIPDGPVAKVGVKTHPWDFQEGLGKTIMKIPSSSRERPAIQHSQTRRSCF